MTSKTRAISRASQSLGSDTASMYVSCSTSDAFQRSQRQVLTQLDSPSDSEGCSPSCLNDEFWCELTHS